MRKMLNNLGKPLLISIILVIPLLVLELLNRRSNAEEFPVALFTFLIVLPIAFILIMRPMVKVDNKEGKTFTNPVWLILRIFFLILIAILWIGVVADQMPCFMGIPNCD